LDDSGSQIFFYLASAASSVIVAAQKELVALVERLTVDPPSPYPWQRIVLNASSHGAIPDDAKFDESGLKLAIAAACSASQQQ
jgi:hypothetical protein